VGLFRFPCIWVKLATFSGIIARLSI